jgi:hypothetical protein
MSESRHLMTSSTPDYKALASDLADSLEAFLWAHAGGDDGRSLPAICRDALEVTERYRKAVGPKRVGLKTLISIAADQARLEGKDPNQAILQAIAYRAKDCYDHMDDDREVYKDIQEWLEYEASLGVEK